jgi:hypothetical protein
VFDVFDVVDRRPAGDDDTREWMEYLLKVRKPSAS